MADETIWKLNLQAGNSDAILKSFENSLSVAKDKINQVVAAGENFSKLDTFQQKAAEAAKKLEVAQAQAALALKKAQDAASGGTASAEQIALAQAKAGLAAEKVSGQEQKLGEAMAKVQLESDRLQTAMAEEANKCESLGKIFTFLKDTASAAASGISTGFTVVKDAIGVASEKVSAFASNMQASMESSRAEIVKTEEVSKEASGGMFSNFKSAASGISGFFSEAGLAINGVQMIIQTVGTAISAVIGPAEQYQEVLKQTDDVIKSTGGAAGLSAKQIADMATALGQTTFFSRDAVQSGENLLLTFKGIGKDVFPAATKTMLDMSKAMGQDVKSSAIQLGKALNDPATGLTALTRVGVTFTDQQKAMIKSMVAAGDTAGAQKIMLAELQSEFGDSSNATKTFAGKWQILTDKFNDFKENLGMAIMPALGNLVDFISSMIMPVLDGFASFIQNVVNPAMGAFGDFIQKHIVPTLQSWGTWIQTWVLDKLGALKSFIDANIMPKLNEFWSFIQKNIIPVLQDWGKNIENWALDKLGGLKSFIDQQVMPKLGDFRNYIQNQIIPTLMSWGGNIKNWVTDKLNDLHAFIDKNIMPKLNEFWGYVQHNIVPVLEDWGHNIQVWVLDKLSDLKTFIDQQVMPKLNQFWGFIQNQVIPTLQTWGDNIKKYALDKLNDLKTFIDQQVMPNLTKFWNFIQNQVIPTLQSWGDTIKKQALDKLADLKTFIDQNVMPALNTFWSFIQNNIIPIFTDWNGSINNVQTAFSNLKDFIDQHVTPVLMGIWNWINTNIIPIFQSLGNILSTDVIPNLGGFTDSVNKLIGALGNLWNAIAPVLMPILAILGWLVGQMLTDAFHGLKLVLDNVVGPAVANFMNGVTITNNSLADMANNAANVVNWIKQLGDAINHLDLSKFWSILTGGIGGSKPSGGGQSVGSFASGIENFGGGLAFVHANEMLVNLPKGTSVWNQAQTAAFMNSAKALQAPSVPAFAASQGSTSTFSNSDNAQMIGLLAGILAELQKHGKVGNVTMNASVTGGSADAQKLVNDLQGMIGKLYEGTARGAF